MYIYWDLGLGHCGIFPNGDSFFVGDWQSSPRVVLLVVHQIPIKLGGPPLVTLEDQVDMLCYKNAATFHDKCVPIIFHYSEFITI